jgi:hypothetical protein
VKVREKERKANLAVSVKQFALSVNQYRCTVKCCSVLFDNTNRKKDIVLLGYPAKSNKLGRGDTDCGIVVFCVPFAACMVSVYKFMEYIINTYLWVRERLR